LCHSSPVLIPVEFHRGIYLPELDLWLDATKPKPWSFVSHAHADHFARHEKALCSRVTGELLKARYRLKQDRLETLDFRSPLEVNGYRLRILPAGHIWGSAMLHLTRIRDGATLLYTGDFKSRAGRSSDAAVFQQADVLITETTFAQPNYIFPPRMEVEMQMVRFAHECFTDGAVPVFLGYALGKAQEAIAILQSHGIPCLVHPIVAEMTDACRESGANFLPECEVFSGEVPAGHALIAPPSAGRSIEIRTLPKCRVAMLTGWALTQHVRGKSHGLDLMIPLSDHADHPGLHECIQRVKPKKILTVHGSCREFAAELRRLGYEAWSLQGNDQLELAMAAPNHSTPKERGFHLIRAQRPMGGLADFSEIGRLMRSTTSQTEKQAHAQRYFSQLEEVADLEISTRWLAGAAVPTAYGVAWLRRAMLSVPGVQEIKLKRLQAEKVPIHEWPRQLFQELTLRAEPLGLQAIQQIFDRLPHLTSHQQIAEMARLFQRVHPTESETILRLLKRENHGISLEGLLGSLADAFHAPLEEIRLSCRLCSNVGEVAIRVKSRTLSELCLNPLHPLKSGWPGSETKKSAIQIHKMEGRVAIFSATGEDLTPRLASARHEISRWHGDFILEARLGQQSAPALLCEQADLFGACPDQLSEIQVTDLLWHEGEPSYQQDSETKKLRLERILAGASRSISIRLRPGAAPLSLVQG
jgi:DNA ligase 1